MSRRINGLIAFLMTFFLMLLIVPVIAYGDDDHTCQGGHNCNNGGEITIDNALTGGDVGVSTRSLIVGSDNDIADCMAHWSAVVLTWPARNKFCELTEFSNWAEHPELHTDASIAIRCSSKPAKDVFGSASQCSQNFKPYEVKITPQTTEDDARIEALYARITDLEAMRIQDKANAEKAAKSVNAAVVRAERRSVSQYGITDEQRQELAEVFKQ